MRFYRNIRDKFIYHRKNVILFLMYNCYNKVYFQQIFKKNQRKVFRCSVHKNNCSSSKNESFFPGTARSSFFTDQEQGRVVKSLQFLTLLETFNFVWTTTKLQFKS